MRCATSGRRSRLSFSPKNDAAAAELLARSARCARCSGLRLDYYGAGGSSRDRSLDLIRRIKGELSLEVMAHLTCAGSSAKNCAHLPELAAAYRTCSLRGDPRATRWAFAHRPGFAHAPTLRHCSPATSSASVARAIPRRTPKRSTLIRFTTLGDQGQRRGVVSHHPAVLRKRALFRVRRARACGRHHGAIIPVSCRSPTSNRCSASPRCAVQRFRRDYVPSSSETLRSAAIVDLGVAFAALQCAICWRARTRPAFLHPEQMPRCARSSPRYELKRCSPQRSGGARRSGKPRR